jgi:chaperone modulatory protein CbpM
MTNDILIGLVLDEQSLLTVSQLCGACEVQTEWIVELVDEGILEPSGQATEHWRFSGPSLQRARTVRRLQQDLGINIAGAALALDLMEENDNLRARLMR